MSSYAMSTDSADPGPQTSSSPPQQQQPQQQQPQQQPPPQQQHQQDHMYSQMAAAHHPSASMVGGAMALSAPPPPAPMGVVGLGGTTTAATVAMAGVVVASCGGGMMPGVPSGPQDSLVPKFPPQNFEVPDISLSNSLTATGVGESFAAPGSESVHAAGGGVLGQSGSLFDNLLSSSTAPPTAESLMETSTMQMPPPQTVPMQQGVGVGGGSVGGGNGGVGGGRQGPLLTTINQSQVVGQLGFQSMRPPVTTAGAGGVGVAGVGVSPAGSGSPPAPAQESSEDSDDSLPLAQLVNLKRAAAGVNVAAVSVASSEPAPPKEVAPPPPKASPVKRQRGGKKKKKKDPNEPQKPVSAYSLFFRDTQSAIKGQNPSASFGEVSRIVASMWDGLDPTQKEVYKKRTEMAKKEYLKQLAAYRASQVSQSAADEASAPAAAAVEKSPSPPSVQNITISPPPVHPPPTTVASIHAAQQQMQHMQQQIHMQQQQQQQTASHSMLHQSPPQYSNAGMNQGEMSMPSYQPELSPSQQPQIDPVMSAAHDSGLFPANSVHQSPSGLHMLCVRDGCQNMAVENPGWDAEYCSNECVVTHCRDIFTAWVAARGGGSTFPVK